MGTWIAGYLILAIKFNGIVPFIRAYPELYNPGAICEKYKGNKSYSLWRIDLRNFFNGKEAQDGIIIMPERVYCKKETIKTSEYIIWTMDKKKP